MNSKPVFETPRLTVCTAALDDVELFLRLWTDPQVMTNVGFPKGLPITRDEIERTICARGESEFEQLLVVIRKDNGESIGECAMRPPDENGIASTDVKLLPKYWGNKYGVEIKRGLLGYLFEHTDCRAVEATPNVDNTASIRMQEAVGGIRMEERTHRFPESMQGYTTPVHFYVYRVMREDWLAGRK